MGAATSSGHRRVADVAQGVPTMTWQNANFASLTLHRVGCVMSMGVATRKSIMPMEGFPGT
jgi:hypothetical protein